MCRCHLPDWSDEFNDFCDCDCDCSGYCECCFDCWYYYDDDEEV